MMKLTSENVETVLQDCLFKGNPTEKEVKERAVIVDGIIHMWGFDPDGLARHKQDIWDMLSQLPDEFFESRGGGGSFLNACMTKDGEQWAEHPSMGKLFALGQATKAVRCVIPRELWAALPGGMPYYVVLDKHHEQPGVEVQPS